MIRSCYFIGTTLAENPVPRHFVALSKELVRRGHQVIIIAPHRRSDLEDHESNPAIYTWPSERPTRLKDVLFLFRLIRKFHPASLIANFAAVNIMTVVGWLTRVPVRVVWYHTIADQLMQDSPVSQWKQKLLRLRKRLVYGVATHIAANSAASARDVQNVYSVPKSKCRVFFNSLADPMRESCFLYAPPRDGKLICVGRLFPSKGQDVLIRALAILKTQVPFIHVDFVGEGPSLAAFQQLARDLDVDKQCTFVGRLDHGEVLKKMAASAATVVPSRNEAFGLVNIESMAMGTPVVASRVGGIIEIVRDGVDGFLVAQDDPKILAEKLSALLLEPGLRQQMSLNARERFLSTFEQQRLVQEQADWQESIVSRERHVPKISVKYGTPS
ncbi:MAG: hypothetical protein JWQ71_292 [Pedosphaera sp.]|nr:hypothetical protein [Pedosphaera sp.]